MWSCFSFSDTVFVIPAHGREKMRLKAFLKKNQSDVEEPRKKQMSQIVVFERKKLVPGG